MSIELTVPTVGESVSEIEIGKWFIEAGGSVKKDDPVVEIESDKATVEIYAPVDGTLTEILKQTGESAEMGDVIGRIEEGKAGAGDGAEKSGGKEKTQERKSKGEAAKPEKAASKTERVEQRREPVTHKTKPPEEREKPDGTRVMPAARRLLDEHAIDEQDVEATGPGGRLLKEDVQRHLEGRGGAAPAEAAEAAASETDGQEEVVRMSPMRRRIASQLVEAQQTAALLTTFNECDMSEVIAFRKAHQEVFQERHGVKLGFMSFFVKACIEALKEYPQVNGEIRGENIVFKNYYNIGIAVGAGKGLVVPVLRNAERMSFAEIEIAIGDFGRRARENKIGLDELKDGTFTISNGGIYGSLLSTPILNPPQSAILGMHAIQERPVVRQGEIVIRAMMNLALTYDHRLVDGREAVTFLVRVKECIENPIRILLDI